MAKERTTDRKDAPPAAVKLAVQADVRVDGNNWVGGLLEATTAQSAPPPTFEFARWGGEDHAPTFECTCELLGVKAHGRGPSKQDAKREAAKAWIDSLCDLVSDGA